MRALGVDLGSKRIGIAVTDPTGTIASPLDVIERGRDEDRDHRRVVDLVVSTGAERIVVGLPLSLDGSIGPAAAAALAEADRLAGVAGVPVETYDERFTTVSAERVLSEQGVSGPARRQVVDKVAAAVMLQAWLDRRSPPPEVQ